MNKGKLFIPRRKTDTRGWKNLHLVFLYMQKKPEDTGKNQDSAFPLADMASG